MKILIKNGRVVDPSQQVDETLDLLIADGIIAEIAEKLSMEVDETIDANGLVVAPGLIDLHVHLREPGYEYKETIETGCRAAVAGGFTAVACMPNTDPLNDNPSVTRSILEKAESVKLAKVYPVACVTKGEAGEELTEMGLLKSSGAVAFSDDGLPVSDSMVMRRALEYTRALSMPVSQHAEDLSLSRGGQMHEGEVSSNLGLAGIPATAESGVVFRDVSLAGLTGGHLHVTHISTKEAMKAVEWGKEQGIHVTVEVTPHHLLLTHRDIGNYDTNCKMKPPLRPEEDRKYLVSSLSKGLIDCVATDHAPHHRDEKDCPFDDAAFGIVGLETALPLMVEHFVKTSLLDLSALVRLMSTNPASIYNLPGGTLRKGTHADVVLFSTSEVVNVEPEKFYSMGRNTPFGSRKVSCRVHMTLVDGRIVFQHGRIA